MKTFAKYLITLVFIAVFVLLQHEGFGQCQACKSTVESNLASGGTAGLGLNSGILYLLAMPYLMIMTIAGIWLYRRRQRKLANG